MNANLGPESTGGELAEGYAIVKELSEKTGRAHTVCEWYAVGIGSVRSAMPRLRRRAHCAAYLYAA